MSMGTTVAFGFADIFVAETAKLLEASRKGEEGRYLYALHNTVCHLDGRMDFAFKLHNSSQLLPIRAGGQSF